MSTHKRIILATELVVISIYYTIIQLLYFFPPSPLRNSFTAFEAFSKSTNLLLSMSIMVPHVIGSLDIEFCHSSITLNSFTIPALSPLNPFITSLRTFKPVAILSHLFACRAKNSSNSNLEGSDVPSPGMSIKCIQH